MIQNLPSTKILGVSITTASRSKILEYLVESIKKGGKKVLVVTPNPEIIVFAQRSKEYLKILNSAQVSIPDGIGVVLAGRIFKKDKITRIPGVDFMEELCCESAKRGFTVGFLGGIGGVAEMTAKRLQDKYPGLRVKFVGEEWNSQRLDSGFSETKKNRLRKQEVGNLKSNHLDILFVAMGFPKQEEWIVKNLPRIDVTVAMGVGGAFDFISGKVVRAPILVRRVGMEWLFRLAVQPWRIKRQLALPIFAAMVFRKWTRGKILDKQFDDHPK